MRRTFWLYFGERILTAVRLPEDASDIEVIAHAIDQERRFPVNHHRPETPAQFESKLSRATVRTFEGE